MTTKEDIKSLLAKESCTMTQKTGKNYSVKSISQKLTNNTLRYEEFKIITEILGYKMKLEKE